MKITVISLARAVARRQAMTEILGALGMEFEFLDATDWKELTAQDRSMVDTVVRERQGQKPLSMSMIATVISHRRALAQLIARGDEMAVVLEDDVTISPEFGNVLSKVERSKDDFDVIFLHRGRSRNAFVPLKRNRPVSAGDGQILGLGNTGLHHHLQGGTTMLRVLPEDRVSVGPLAARILGDWAADFLTRSTRRASREPRRAVLVSR